VNSGSSYEFTEDFFTFRIDLWDKLLHRMKGRPYLRFLEIGVFEGRATVWLLQNVLTHSTASIDCVDPFEWTEGAGRPGADMDAVERRFSNNVTVSGASDRVRLLRMKSEAALCTLLPRSYDFIYVDGSHSAADVLTDATFAFRLLKCGGILAFDDYLLAEAHGQPGSLDDPRAAIDAFLSIFAPRLDFIWKGYQVVVSRRSDS
jgi:predicted O-methyltransferase YrrM